MSALRDVLVHLQQSADTSVKLDHLSTTQRLALLDWISIELAASNAKADEVCQIAVWALTGNQVDLTASSWQKK